MVVVVVLVLLLLVQHHPTLLDATCWPRLNTMLEDVGLILNLLKISSNIMQHCWANNVACCWLRLNRPLDYISVMHAQKKAKIRF